jgi:hypothetical protein
MGSFAHSLFGRVTNNRPGIRAVPKPSRCFDWIHFESLPPLAFVADTVQLAMMGAAKRHRELIADFAPQCSGLREAEMVGIARLAAADETWLGGDKVQVVLVSKPPRFCRYRSVRRLVVCT